MRWTAAVVAIFLLGLGLRIDYAWEGRAPVYDAVAYGEIAEQLANGDGFSLGRGATQPASNYSPGLPLLVAGIYEITGGIHERAARLLLAALGALAVLFTYLIGRALAGPTAGLIGAAAVAIYPALLEYQGMFMGEPLAASLLSGAVLALLWASDPRPTIPRTGGAVAGVPHGGGREAPEHMGEGRRDRTRAPRWLVPGLLLGALALVRPEHLGVSLVVAAVVVAWSRPAWRVGAVNAAILLAGVALIVAPWTVRNAIALDRFVPVSTGGGQVLFAGSYMPSDGNPERVGEEVLERHPGLTRRLSSRFVGNSSTNSERVAVVLQQLRLEQILAALAAQRYPELEADRALSRIGRERFWDDVTDRPLAYAGFITTKVWRAWSRGPREVMERPGWRAMHWAIVGFALSGLLVLARRRPREALLLTVLLLSITAFVALLVASPRRALVALPLVAALAGVGATACADSLARRCQR